MYSSTNLKVFHPTAMHQLWSLQVCKADPKHQLSTHATLVLLCASICNEDETTRMTEHMQHTQPTQLGPGMPHTSQQGIAGATMLPANLIYKGLCAHNELKEPHLHCGHWCIPRGLLQQGSKVGLVGRRPLVVVAPLQAGHLLLHDADALPQLLHLLLQRHVLHHVHTQLSAGHGHGLSSKQAPCRLLCYNLIALTLGGQFWVRQQASYMSSVNLYRFKAAVTMHICAS